MNGSNSTAGTGVTTLEHVWIPMRDGTRLSARVWLPETAVAAGGRPGTPAPAILEYIPYRKRDMTRGRDGSMHPYFASFGYASIRVDLRGSGDSEGVLTDEYLPQELDDGEDVIAWLAEQEWCDGQVGMIGISWGGFNGLQIAARRPPQLKAVVSVCSTDDRYADDVHYMGGALLGDNISWASTMLAYNSMPPDPALVGDRWREMWLDRLNGSGLWLKTWLEHQHRDEYWKHGS
ncbi:MAG: CocE/NonD family hydrolase, partial [Alkalispirochaeta sp.]